MAESATSLQRRPLRLLSLDGGGIRGISELVILGEIMHRLKKRMGSREDLLPADYFDMIGGTSTGGLIAILLGRLRLSVPAAMEKYARLSEKVFGERKKFGNILRDGNFKASNLEKAIKTVLEEKFGPGHGEEKMFEEGSEGCKTFVCAMLAKHLDRDPYTFRTWETAKTPSHNCCIWEACRATAAAPRFFKPISIGDHNLQEEYVDGGLGCNNPVKTLLKEAATEFGPEARISCIVSIGTGRRKVSQINPSSQYERTIPLQLVKALEAFTTSSEGIAKDMEKKYQVCPGLLQRLNVEFGLESTSLDEWSKLGEVKTHTEKYLKHEDVDRRIDLIVDALLGKAEKTYHFGQLDNCVPYPLPIHARKLGFHCFPPYLVNHFVERKEVLDDMAKHLDSSRDSSKAPVYVLQGLGGCGKSQLALKYCQKTADETPERHVLWIDANSATTARQSIAKIVKLISPGIAITDDESNLQRFKETIQKAGASKQYWLLVFDNYDDPRNFNSKSIKDFFPQATCGAIIVTTRVAGMSRLGQFRSISTLSGAEALELLFRSSKSEKSDTNLEEAAKIVKRLGFHALAIDQAGAYIRSRGLELGCFLDYYTNRREKVLKEIPEEWTYFGRFKGNPDAEIELSVFTTWELSLDQISGSDAAQKDKRHILALSGFLNNTEIKGVYFEAHASDNLSWLPSCRNNKDWDIYEFQDILRELHNLSLLESFESKSNGASYSLHPLIQEWMKLRVNLEQRKKNAIEAYLLLCSYLQSARDKSDLITKIGFEEKQILLAHVNTALYNRQEYQLEGSALEDENSLLAMHEFGVFLFDMGHYERAEKLCRHVLAIERRTLGNEHLDTLASMGSLALYLKMQAKYDEAESLYKEVISLTKKVEGEDSFLLLRRTNNFAGLLINQSRYEEIEHLLQPIILNSEKTLGRDHEAILTSKNFLAESLRGQKRFEEAEVLHREVLLLRKSTLGNEHLETLASMNNLALVLEDQGKTKEAGKLYQECLLGTEKVYGKMHPETLNTVYNIGHLYLKDDNLIDADAFFRRSFEGRQAVLGSNHPDTLKSLHGLGVVLHKKGDLSAAEEIFRSLIPQYESVFGHNHWDTTNCIVWLRNTLSEAGNQQEAQELHREIDKREREYEEEKKAKPVAFPSRDIEEVFGVEDSDQKSSDSWSTVDS